MKTVLYYFTGTGNSLKVAKDLAVELGDTELIPLAKVIKDVAIAPAADRVGIVFPVYMWGMPLIVADFVKKITLNKSAYIFAVVNYGSTPGSTLIGLNKLLKNKGLKLSAGFGVTMPGNYIPLYGARSPETQGKHFKKEQEKIKKIAEVIRQNKPAGICRNNFLFNLLFSGLFYRVSAPQIPRLDKYFWADEKCNSCAVCVKVCPVNNIKMEGAKPRWLSKCQQCFACLQWCPEEAIQYGSKTAKRQRYRQPQIKIEEIIGQK
jgi:ferredoxin